MNVQYIRNTNWQILFRNIQTAKKKSFSGSATRNVMSLLETKTVQSFDIFQFPMQKQIPEQWLQFSGNDKNMHEHCARSHWKFVVCTTRESAKQREDFLQKSFKENRYDSCDSFLPGRFPLILLTTITTKYSYVLSGFVKSHKNKV